MRIQHNIMAMNAYRNYSNNTGKLSKNLEKLSSGYRINRAGDDAAGLAISEKMRAQITGLDAAQKNIKDGISLVKTAEGALQEVQDMLNRMQYLATQSANGTYDNAVDRANLQKEVDALKTEIDRIADASNFNGQKLLNGELYGGMSRNYKSSGTDGTIDVNVTLDSYTDSTGATKKFTLKFAKSGNADSSASIAAGGTDITVSIGNTTDKMTAEKIAELISNATVNAADKASEDAIKTALKSVTVSGMGIDTAITTTGTTAADPGAGTDLLIAGAESMTLQIGETADNYNQMRVSIRDMHTAALGIDKLDISSLKGAQAAITSVKSAINAVSSNRGTLGAIQNRLEHTQNNLGTMKENIQDAEASIRDTDIADEMTSYTKNNILLQSAQAMLAQANQAPQGVLQLLQ